MSALDVRAADGAGACDACLHRSNVIATLAARIEGLLQRPGDRIADLLALSSTDLIEALVPADQIGATREAVAMFDPRSARAEAGARRLWMLCRHSAGYPEALRGLRDAPPVLWLRGRADCAHELLAAPAVAIVGSRRPSSYGLEVAEELARGLSSAGIAVVSGLAMGVDAAAHRGALRSSTPRTVAVLGSGVDVVYPRVNRRLYERILESGLVMSESPPGRRPFRWTFPARNRIMAALTAMTVVVEASEPSGSLITAAFAAELGRGVAAVPGRVTSATAAGSNRLLRDGAAVIRDAGDVLDEMFGVGGSSRLAAAASEPVLEPDERLVLEAVENGADVGAIAASAELPPSRVRVLLGRLESAGLIRRSGIAEYVRVAG